LKSLIFQLHAASVQNISLAPGGTVISDIYKHHFKTALKRYNDIHKLLRPWDEIEEIKDTEPTPGSSMSSEEIANLIKKYKEIYKQEPVKDVQPV
jgi:hypothetical protein